MRHAGSFVVTMMLAALPLYACAGSTAIESDAGPPPTEDGGTLATTAADLRTNVRAAFIAEAEWTRIYGVSALEGRPDAQPALRRLNETEAQIVAQVAPFVDDAAAAQLAALLHARASALVDVVASMTDNIAPRTNDVQSALDANAQEIADFFATLCPNAFPATAVGDLKAADRSMVSGLQARMSNDDAGAVGDFDQAQVSSTSFGDAVSAALATTFSARVAPPTTSPVGDELALRIATILADQAFWMRSCIVDEMHKLPAQAELDRAVKASADLGQLFATYFGQDVGKQIQLGVHTDTTDAIAYMFAISTQTQGTVEALAALWDSDMKRLAQYLAVTTGANQTTVQGILETNAERERAMLSARSQKQWDADATDYQNVIDNRETLAKVLASAIVANAR